MKAYIDSDVLIWHLRGERKALNLLKKLRDEPPRSKLRGGSFKINELSYPIYISNSYRRLLRIGTSFTQR